MFIRIKSQYCLQNDSQRAETMLFEYVETVEMSVVACFQ